MIKTLIAALFLSQAPIQAMRVLHDNHSDVLVPVRWTNTVHIRSASLSAVVVSEDTWYTKKAPIPYWEYWACPFGQTAQQCVAIYSLLEQKSPL